MTQSPDTTPLIHLDEAWKKFGLTLRANQRRLSSMIARNTFGLGRREHRVFKDEFWSLQGLSFEVKRGEAIGLIGPNGAGKSTLLRALAGHIELDHGHIKVAGRVSELINLTAGYQPLLSGRENIRITGALRGLDRSRMEALTDDIIEFAEIGEFIDSPFGSYSSGMKLRLAFSVAVHANPDVLLIDEVIGVGDFAFRQKCLEKLHTMREGAAIVLCTHNINHLAAFCDRVLVLDHGAVIFDGPAKEALDFYVERFGFDGTKAIEAGVDDDALPLPAPPPLDLGPIHHDKDAVLSVEAVWRDAETGEVATQFGRTGVLELDLSIKLEERLSNTELGLVLFLYDEHGEPAARVASQVVTDDQARVSTAVQFRAGRILDDTYLPVLRIAHGPATLYRDQISPLNLTGRKKGWGKFKLDAKWAHDS